MDSSTPSSGSQKPLTSHPLFAAKKSKILAQLAQSENEYADNSPKGSVDEQIVDLIDEINSYEGLVTTSSCAGRVAVFVEGGAGQETITSSREGATQEAPELLRGKEQGTVKTSPGGKGGGQWLYVSHDPIPRLTSQATDSQTGGPGHDRHKAESQHKDEPYTTLFKLNSTTHSGPQTTNRLSNPATVPSTATQLIHLIFSPLILHIQCASLAHARPLLSAAINSGFRESGVQSLRILDDPGAGVMLAIRTAGLTFETVVGCLGEDGLHKMVTEDYLAMCAHVVNQRFRWNSERKERLTKEIRIAMQRQMTENTRTQDWEDKDDRRRRKREEGLQRQKQQLNTALELDLDDESGHSKSGRRQSNGESDGSIDLEMLQLG
ncbi:hypothetical protein B0A52_06981 [Exophiala mesophila]|uniref:tRNA(Phe) 7-[(3-amino-3-carboxypropyl)-4-demethylwyosine(37)-N(4)]-methyltransferase n=1 Tax=Exophiala mesophila TaxID=212818 RepID=A0A438N0Y1_EXOME|nr:hypothetical protein B0A52_06981 [Exophiala mesophila]